MLSSSDLFYSSDSGKINLIKYSTYSKAKENFLVHWALYTGMFSHVKILSIQVSAVTAQPK